MYSLYPSSLSLDGNGSRRGIDNVDVDAGGTESTDGMTSSLSVIIWVRLESMLILVLTLTASIS
jgi:hypothetical protein